MNIRTEKRKKDMRIEKPIIFIGTGRSGTTIISEIIMRHRDLAFPSNYQEVFFMNPKINLIRNFFDNKFCKIYGQKKQLNKVSIINKYIFKPAEAYKMWDYLTGSDIDFSRGFLLNKKATKERVSFINNYFQKMIKYQNKKRLVFKITGPSRISYLLSIFPDALFVNVQRKAIPAISSLIKVKFWKTRGFSKLWWIGAYSREEQKWAIDHKNDPISLTAFQLKKISEITDFELKKYIPQYINVNYEDFIEEPNKEIIKILKFVGLKVDNACIEYLTKNKIYNRNKPDKEYFNESELIRINEILFDL